MSSLKKSLGDLALHFVNIPHLILIKLQALHFACGNDLTTCEAFRRFQGCLPGDINAH